MHISYNANPTQEPKTVESESSCLASNTESLCSQRTVMLCAVPPREWLMKS